MNSSNSYDEEPITPLILPGALVDCHRQEAILLSAEKLRVFSVPGVYIAARFPEDAVVIVKELEENKYIISPNSPALLFECQTLYNTRELDFSLAQVYVAMMKMSRKHTLEGQIGDWLRFMMRKCLCSTELNRGDEGPFIRVALALQRRVKVRLHKNQIYDFSRYDISISEVVLETFLPRHARPESSCTAELWFVEFSLSDFSYSVSKEATISELASSFSYI